MSRWQEIREQCAEANRRLPTLGLVDLTFGNVSVAHPVEPVFAIKPSGVDYADLTPADIVIVGFDGATLEGKLRPSSDTPTHAHLLRSFPTAKSVVHTHSRHATSWAQAGLGIPCLGTTHADYFYGEVPVTRLLTPEEIAGDYELATGRVIVERFADLDPSEVSAVLVHGHGPFAWGPTAAKAVENAQALEIIAEMAWKTRSLNPAVPPLPPPLLDKHFRRKHGPGAYYGQPR
jgi:L-ribulose-5-phosphate 4-epimerase